ncbi:hypothetical protein F5880DRAFT_1602500, partial [Lentinula raphanica]
LLNSLTQPARPKSNRHPELPSLSIPSTPSLSNGFSSSPPSSPALISWVASSKTSLGAADTYGKNECVDEEYRFDGDANNWNHASSEARADCQRPTLNGRSVRHTWVTIRYLIIPCRPNLPDHPSNGGFIRSHPTVCCISFSLVSPRHLILKLVISRMKKTSLSITCMAQDSIPVVIHPCNRSLIPSRLPTKTVPSLDPLDPLPNKENACQPPPPARTQPRSSLVGLVIHAILQEGIRLRGRQDQMAFRLSMNSVRVSTQTPLGLQYPQSVCVEFVAFLRRSRSYCRSNEQI